MAKSLFFIDDDEIFLYLLERTCKKIKTVTKVYTAMHGKDGLDKIDSWLANKTPLPNIMFVDVNMPIMDGFEFLAKFKKKREESVELKKIIPLVMLTSSQQASDKERARETGIIEKYIIKPSDTKEMEKMLKELTE